jgi:hypothetical protein
MVANQYLNLGINWALELIMLVYIVAIWYILSLFGIKFQEKSGNPVARHHLGQGCQMVYFQTKNPNLGIFWRVLQWKMLYILWSFGIFSPVLVCCAKKNLATLILVGV